MTTAISEPEKPGQGIDAIGSIDNLSSDELRDMLIGLLGLTAETMMRMAAIVRVLEDRGIDVADMVPKNMLPTLRGIAYGTILPNVYVRFSGTREMLRLVQTLPAPDQKYLADGGMVELVVWDEAGKPTKRKADPLLMTKDQTRQVFGHGVIRDEAAQLLILDQQRSESKRNRPTAVGPLAIDADRDGVVHKGVFLSRELLVTALKALR